MMEPDVDLAEHEERLGELVADWLEGLERGETRDRRDWLARRPEFAAELEEYLFQEDRMSALAAPLREAARAAMVSTPPPWDPSPGPFGEYELLGEIGRGGMAVVFKARQTSLGRLVALKLFRADPAARPSDLQRFRHEAELVARLDHPSIVPVHDVGEQGGHVYYTMKLIEGGDLDAHLARFVADPRGSATLLATAARAVHHAHKHGILHRDLKPSNILLSEAAAGQAPTPMIADFGLARRVGGDAGLTHTGAILGTPAYMAPEQAAGEKDALTTATDVHGLGTILYALLTGKPPFQAASVLETLEQVKGRDPIPPSQVNPRVPHDLGTICVKALRKEPSRRYESAAALADDLERWLRGEPILARPAGRVERLARWCRRHPAQSILAAALLLAVATGFALVLWQWQRAEDNFASAERLRGEAVAQEAEAEESFRLAHEAVKDFATRPEGGGMLEARGLDPLRLELMQKARDYYEKFLDRRGRDPALRRESAEISARLADIIRQTGAPAEAREAYRRALAQYDAMLEDDPRSLPLHLDLARLHSQLCAVHMTLDRPDDAVGSVKRAGAVLEAARAFHPGDPSLVAELASNRHNLGMFQRAANRSDAALASFAEARRMLEGLTRTRPDDVEIQRLLANTLNSTALVHEDRGRPAEALPLFQEASAVSERLERRQPGKRILEHALGQQLANMGECLQMCKRSKEAQESLDRARVVLEGVSRAHPHVPDYRASLGLCRAALGRTRMALEQPDEALESFEAARSAFRLLANEYPGVIEYRHRLFQIATDLGLTHSHLRRPARSLDAYKEAQGVAAWLAEKHPESPEDASRLGLTWSNLAVAHAKMGRLKEAHEAALQAVPWQRKAVQKAPKTPAYRDKLANHYALLAALADKLGLTDEAREATRQRLDLLGTEGKRSERGVGSDPRPAAEPPR